MDPWLAGCLLFAVGAVAATVNVVAGGGSFLVLPVLLFLGLPPAVANATNRVGVLAQTITSSALFHGLGLVDHRLAWRASVPAAVGALIGAWAALQVSDMLFRRALAVVMLTITFATFFKRPGRASFQVRSGTPAWVMVAFFGVGLYGGFIQAGVGFLVLGITNALALDLVRANAIKNRVVLVLTALALALFMSHDAVHWGFGLALAAGNVVGGGLGVRVAVVAGHRWLHRIVTATIVVFAMLLLLSG
jgi:uncharacterized membrane protein YfcA